MFSITFRCREPHLLLPNTRFIPAKRHPPPLSWGCSVSLVPRCGRFRSSWLAGNRWPFSLFSKSTSHSSPTPRPPPPYKRVKSEHIVHGCAIRDDYAWLQDANHPEVARLVDAEEAYADEVLRETQHVQQQVYAELTGKLPTEDSTCGERFDGYEYYLHFPTGENFPVYCRRSLDGGREEVLVDQNLEGRGHPFINVHSLKVSLDNGLLAYSRDTSGDDTFDMVVKDIASGRILMVKRHVSGFDWAGNRTLFYTTPDDMRRPHKVWRLHVGGRRAKHHSKLIYHEPRHAYFLDVHRTKDKAYIVVSSNSKSTTEVRLIPTMSPLEKPMIAHKARKGHECYVDHRENEFLFVRKPPDGDFALYSLDEVDALKAMRGDTSHVPTHAEDTSHVPTHAEDTSHVPTHAEDALMGQRVQTPMGHGTSIHDIDVFRDHIVTYERHMGTARIGVLHRPSDTYHQIPLPEEVCAVHPGGNMEFSTHMLRFSVSSPISPETVFDYNMKERKLSLVKKEHYPGYAPEKYHCERLNVQSHDGVHVPLTLVSKKEFNQKGGNPTLLVGYGAYGQMLEAEFDIKYSALLDRGWNVALAHVRGGGELGHAWYMGGKQYEKLNSFHDFIACADHLVDVGTASPSHLAAHGSSAGGLLVGAAINLRPELFKAAILSVPFVDVLTTMLDTSLPLTIHEFDEWGDPAKDRRAFDVIKGYDPYHNLNRASGGPAMLISGSFLDDRVPYWHPLKYVAKCRGEDVEHNAPVLLNISKTTGHSGEGGKFSSQARTALEWAFLLKYVGDGR